MLDPAKSSMPLPNESKYGGEPPRWQLHLHQQSLSQILTQSSNPAIATKSSALPRRVDAPSSSETEYTELQAITSPSSNDKMIPISDLATWLSKGAHNDFDHRTSTTAIKKLQCEAECLEAAATKAGGVKGARAKAKSGATAALAAASRDTGRIPRSLQAAPGTKDRQKKFWDRRTGGGGILVGRRDFSSTAESLLGEADNATQWEHDRADQVAAETTTPMADPRQSGPPSGPSIRTPSEEEFGPALGSSLLHQQKRVGHAPVPHRLDGPSNPLSERSESISERVTHHPSGLLQKSSGHTMPTVPQRRPPRTRREFRKITDETKDDVVDHGGQSSFGGGSGGLEQPFGRWLGSQY